jgi:hypothetical protein
MKKYIKKLIREIDVGAPSKTKKLKNKKNWILEYRWKSKIDYEKYPKWFLSNREYNEDWNQDRFQRKFSDDIAVKEYLKSQLRSHYHLTYIKGREWRGRNIETQKIVEFPNIENYYLL